MLPQSLIRIAISGTQAGFIMPGIKVFLLWTGRFFREIFRWQAQRQM
jgi:hypothetical protein